MKIIILCLILNNFNINNDSITMISYYSNKHHGKKTASGKKFNMNNLTAAHKTLPFGTKVKITNLKNNKSVIITINDRGPFIKNRGFDLSKAAFKKISSLKYGKIKVKYKILKYEK